MLYCGKSKCGKAAVSRFIKIPYSLTSVSFLVVFLVRYVLSFLTKISYNETLQIKRLNALKVNHHYHSFVKASGPETGK